MRPCSESAECWEEEREERLEWQDCLRVRDAVVNLMLVLVFLLSFILDVVRTDETNEDHPSTMFGYTNGMVLHTRASPDITQYDHLHCQFRCQRLGALVNSEAAIA